MVCLLCLCADAVVCLLCLCGCVQIYDHPWYNKNLPPGVKEMNDHPQPLPAGLQSQEEIQKIVAVSAALTYCPSVLSGGGRCAACAVSGLQSQQQKALHGPPALLVVTFKCTTPTLQLCPA